MPPKKENSFTPLEILLRKISGKFFCPKIKIFQSKSSLSSNKGFKPSSARFLTGFTLIELLIVIGILAILAVTAIIVLNPTELLAQARDTTRLSDLGVINKALGIALVQGLTSFGTTNTLYISIPDSSSTCLNLGLPSLPAGWSYACVASTTLRKIDGTGWIPVDFTALSIGTPLDSLPIDPINTTTSLNYYTYTPGGSWELTALMESAKYQARGGRDGGLDPAQYEIGTNLALTPFAHGLVGWWKFEEGSGSNANDSSGYASNGTWSGSGAHYAAGKIGSYTGQFNGTDDDTEVIPIPSSLKPTGDISIMAWINGVDLANAQQAQTVIQGAGDYQNVFKGYFLMFQSTPYPRFKVGDGASPNAEAVSPTPLTSGTWHHVAGVFSTSAGTIKLFINGSEVASNSHTKNVISYTNDVWAIGRLYNSSAWYRFQGLIDDVRIYNRALSAAEISAIYNATQ